MKTPPPKQTPAHDEPEIWGGVDKETLKILCGLTVELTALRQQGCSHLCIENFSPNLLKKLIGIIKFGECNDKQ